jgi:hypothetical protein
MNSQLSDYRNRNVQAIAAGFLDAAEMTAANDAGFADPVAYRSRLATDRARADAEKAKLAVDGQTARLKLAADNAVRELNRNTAEEAGVALLRERNRDPGERITMPSFSWKIGGFGFVGTATVTVNNGNDFSVKEIEVRCEFSRKSGTELSRSQRTIFDTIPAKAVRMFKDVNMGFIRSQSAKASCPVETAKQL